MNVSIAFIVVKLFQAKMMNVILIAIMFEIILPIHHYYHFPLSSKFENEYFIFLFDLLKIFQVIKFKSKYKKWNIKA